MGVVLRGAVSAVTVASSSNNGVWIVPWLWHYIATEDMARPGYQIAQAVTGTVRINPQWVAAHYPQSQPHPQMPGTSSSQPFIAHHIQHFQIGQGNPS